MPQLGNMKFPYTPAGKARYQKIKKAIGSKSAKRPSFIGSKSPVRPSRPKVPGMYYPGSKKKLR
jgi:hypothetical protein